VEYFLILIFILFVIIFEIFNLVALRSAGAEISPDFNTTVINGNFYNKIMSKKPFISRQYSTLARLKKTIDRADFIEWFRGFTDGEGCFFIAKNNNYFRFFFQIKLHIDDRNVLNFIKEYLGIGKIYTSKNEATFVVTAKEEVKIIIDIFSKSPLNTTKHLNFLSFKKAFELYTNFSGNSLVGKDGSPLSREDLHKEIEFIKSCMNSKRSDFERDKLDKIQITDY
jgi:hypothetical protein